MARSLAATIFETKAPAHRRSGTSFREIADGELEVQSILDGMHTNTARDDIPRGAAELIQNGRVRDEWCGRRGGLTELIGRPDSNEIIGLSTHFPSEADPWIIRVTPSSMHATNDIAQWQTVSGPTPGTTSFRMNFAQFIGDHYMASRVNKLTKIDVDSLVAEEIDQAPKARFVTTFANRLVAARTADKPGKIFWSGRLEPEIWDPNEDISAGFENLVVGQSDVGDDVTNIFGFEDTLIILRERSIWHATRRPFARAPFKFTQAIGNQGCDLPNSAVRVTTEGRNQAVGGIMFADYQTNGVWFYRPGIRPQRVSRQIEDQLFDDIEDKDEVYAAFDLFNQEYHLRVSPSTIWVYSLRHRAWTRDDGPDVSALYGFETISDITVIDDLQGTIDDQQGVIDDLNEEAVSKPGILKGTSAGHVLFHDRGVLDDFDGTSFEFIFETPNMGSTLRRRTFKAGVARGLINTISENGEITTELSNDGASWRKTLTHQYAAETPVQIIGHRLNKVTGHELFWRIRTTQTDLRLLSYFARILEKSVHRT